MTVSAGYITVTTSATLLCNGQYGTKDNPATILIKNISDTTVYLGGASVSDYTNGYPLSSGEVISIDLIKENLYGVAAADKVIQFLHAGVGQL